MARKHGSTNEMSCQCPVRYSVAVMDEIPVNAGNTPRRPAPREGASLLLLTALACAGLLAFYFFDPATARGFWVCPFHRVTGWECPGCGGQRALHALLHGRLSESLRLNAFAVLVVFPLALWAFAAHALRVLTGKRLPVPRAAGWALALFLAAAALFGVARNLWGALP